MTEGSGIDALRAALAAVEAKALEAEARAANEAARVSDAEAKIAFLKLAIEKLRREIYGWRSERKQRLLDQLELQLDELETSATEDEPVAERLHGDDTPVPVLARGKYATGRAWVYVRDDRPFGGADPPAALFRYSRDRSGVHPVEHPKTFTGILQADIYADYNALYVTGRSSGPVTEAGCWAHSRRKFFELADIAASKRRGKTAPPISPLALEAVKRIDLLFDIEHGIVGESAEERPAVRRELSAPALANLRDWMEAERRKLSKHAPVAKAMDYMHKRWALFARFLDDGRICLTNNAAERCLRGIALGRKSWLFAGSDRGGVRAAAMYTLIGTAKLNDVDPQAWFADVLVRIAETPQSRLDELFPWNWVPEQKLNQAA